MGQSEATVIPQEAVFPVGQSAKDYAKESNKEMSSSQSAAATGPRSGSSRRTVMTCPV